MSYFEQQQPQQPYQPTFRQAPATAYPVDADDDRIYTEEDYAVPPDGDAFAPDDAEDAIPYADPYQDPFAAQQPLSYAGSYETLVADGDWQDEEELEDSDVMLTDEELAEMRRSDWKLLATLADFGGVILGTAAILVLIALLVSLMNWLINDISQTFTLLQGQM